MVFCNVSLFYESTTAVYTSIFQYCTVLFYTLWRYRNIVCLLAITNAVSLSCNQRPIYSCNKISRVVHHKPLRKANNNCR